MQSPVITAITHGPMFTRPARSGDGWIVPSCDCGWAGRPVHGALLGAQAYGDHIAQVASEPAYAGAHWTAKQWDEALAAGQRAGSIRHRVIDRQAADVTVSDQETWFALAEGT